MADAEGPGHDDRSGRIGKNVAKDDAPRAGPQRARRSDEFPLAQAEHFRPHQPARPEPPGQPNQQHQYPQRDVLPQRHGPDAQRDAGPVHEPAPHLPAERVGAKQELRGRRPVGLADIDLVVGWIRRHDGRRERDGDEEREHEQSGRGRRVPEKPPPRGGRPHASSQRRDDDERQDRGPAQSEPVPDVQAPPPPPSPPTPTRIPGAATPYNASAIRLPKTTIVLVTRAAPVTTG